MKEKLIKEVEGVCVWGGGWFKGMILIGCLCFSDGFLLKFVLVLLIGFSVGVWGGIKYKILYVVWKK